MLTTTTTTAPDTILLIHGMWMTPKSWRPWIRHFEKQGFRVLAPAWPGLEVEVDELRKDSTPLAKLTTKQIVDHYEAIIRSLPTKPILIGHSYGGAIVQALLARGLGAAGVALHSAFVKGVYRLPLRTLRSTFFVAGNPLNARRAVPMSKKGFHYAFASTVSREESDRIYDELHVPAAGRAFFEGITANFRPNSVLKVNPKDDNRAPLLIVGSDADNLLPLAMQRANYKLYAGKSRAVVELLDMPGRSHDTVGQAGWENVADTVLGWALDKTTVVEKTLVTPPVAMPVAARTVAIRN
jgi:pimeloyl-ACP methyl ester carboxylesterase